jgi:hypothetical protein
MLLLANLALFGWMRWGSMLTVDVNAVSAQAPMNADRIDLLEFVPASAAASAVPAQGVLLPLVPPPAPATPPAQPPAHPQPQAVASAPAVAPAPHSAPVAVPVVEAVKPVAPPKEANCAEWGQFAGEDLSRAREALETLKLGKDLSQHAIEQDHGYWVYLPPQKKRADVDKKIAQLKERGVKDYFIVQEKGKWLNAISLGVFKNAEAAEKFLATLRTKGVRSAKVGQRKSKLKYTIFTMKDLDSGTLDKLRALRKEFPGSEFKTLECSN